MYIRIEVESLKELQDVVEGLMVYSPGSEQKSKKQVREEKEIVTVRTNYDKLHKRICDLLDKKKSVKEIAKEVGCSPATVYNHKREYEGAV